MNQLADDQGSDGKNAPTVSVSAGAAKGGKDVTAGRPQAQFHDKTKLAEGDDLADEREVRAYIREILKEQIESKVQEEDSVNEAAAEDLVDSPDASEDELGESGRFKSLGRVTNLKPTNYPDNLKR